MTLKRSTSLLLIAFFVLALVSPTLSFEQLDTVQSYSAYLEQNAQYVFLHVFHNRHFKNSRQFKDFLEVLEDVEFRVKDFCKIVLTDCEKDKDQKFDKCVLIKENNENRILVGMKPTDQFFTLGQKRLQRAPTEVTYNHPSDVYQVTGMAEFLENLIPNYATIVATQEELKEFLTPRYSPKLLYFTKQDEVPFNIRKLSTYFHCYIDFAFIEDLSDDLVEMYEIKKFPSLLLLEYNYSKGQFDQFPYEGPQFDLGGYVRMKEFLSKFALDEPRTDLMFHTIHMPKKSQLQTVDNDHELWKMLDRSPGWTIIQYGPKPSKISQIRDRYGEYFSYIHYLSQEDSILKSYLPRFNETHELVLKNGNEIRFRTMSSEEALSNASMYGRQNYSIVIVREKYGHLCSISQQTFFRGILFCIILDENDYDIFKEKIGSDVDYGIYVSLGEQGNDLLSVHKIKDAEFKTTYQTLEYLTRVRIQKLTEDFFKNPVKEVTTAVQLSNLCSDPFRKCIIALMNPQKTQAHKTELGYLTEIAKNYFEQFKFFWVDAACNKQLKEMIEEHKVSLFVYSVSDRKYTTLKTKLTKSNIQKFLKLVHRDQVQMKHVPNPRQLVNACLGDQL